MTTAPHSLHIPACCWRPGSSSAMRMDFQPCMLHVARQLISKCRVQNECSTFCSHHIHTHTPACCQWPGGLLAMRMSGSASATNGHEGHHIHLISLPAAGLLPVASSHSYPRLLPVHRQFIGNEDIWQCISNERPRQLHHIHFISLPAARGWAHRQ